jgi:hypothetical protein
MAASVKEQRPQKAQMQQKPQKLQDGFVSAVSEFSAWSATAVSIHAPAL